MALTRRLRKKVRTRRYKKPRRHGKTRRIKYRSSKRRYEGGVNINTFFDSVKNKDNVVSANPAKEPAWSEKSIQKNPDFIARFPEIYEHNPTKPLETIKKNAFNIPGSVPYNTSSFNDSVHSVSPYTEEDLSFSNERRITKEAHRNERKRERAERRAERKERAREEENELTHIRTIGTHLNSSPTLPGQFRDS